MWILWSPLSDIAFFQSTTICNCMSNQNHKHRISNFSMIECIEHECIWIVIVWIVWFSIFVFIMNCRHKYICLKNIKSLIDNQWYYILSSSSFSSTMSLIIKSFLKEKIIFILSNLIDLWSCEIRIKRKSI